MKPNAELEKCCFCDAPIPTIFEKNNPYPVHDSGNCCSDCNLSIVIPARILKMEHMPLPSEDDMIDTCTGHMGYSHGDFHYWKSIHSNCWAGTEIDSDGVGGNVFFAFNHASMLHIVRMFQAIKDSGGKP